MVPQYASPGSSPDSSPTTPGSGHPIADLRRLEGQIDTLRLGLSELESSPSYLLLRDATAGSETARRYQAAAGDRPLWPMLDAVGRRLAAIATDHGLSGPGGAADPASVAADLALTVTGPEFSAAPPAALVSEVRRRHDALAGAVADIDTIWLNVLPRIEAARTTLERLQAEADELAIREPLIGRARTLANELADRLLSDPAGVEVVEAHRLDARVAEAARHMAEARAGRDSLDTDLAGTEELLASLRTLLARARATTAEVTARIADPGPMITLPADAIIDGPGGLADLLDDVFAVDPAARWEHRRAALDRWLERATALEGQLVRALDTNGSPLDRRDELRGRLEAFRAKMAGRGRAEDAELTAIVERAWNHLYTAPTSLEEAEDAVARLARRLLGVDEERDRGRAPMRNEVDGNP